MFQQQGTRRRATARPTHAPLMFPATRLCTDSRPSPPAPSASGMASPKLFPLPLSPGSRTTSKDLSSISAFYVSVRHSLPAIFQAVPAGSPSRGGDVTVYVLDISQPSLPTCFYSVLVSVSVFMALSTVFHSINSPDNSPLSHDVLLVLPCLIGPFNNISLYESLPQP